MTPSHRASYRIYTSALAAFAPLNAVLCPIALRGLLFVRASACICARMYVCVWDCMYVCVCLRLFYVLIMLFVWMCSKCTCMRVYVCAWEFYVCMYVCVWEFFMCVSECWLRCLCECVINVCVGDCFMNVLIVLFVRIGKNCMCVCVWDCYVCVCGIIPLFVRIG